MSGKDKSQSLETLLNRAMGLHQAGQLEPAEALYLQVLQLRPANFEAQHLLGVLRGQQGRLDEALALVAAALRVRPQSPAALSNQGLILNRMKRHAEALASFDRALALRPDYAEALNNAGNALAGLSRHDEALSRYDSALAARPQYAEALLNRGNVLTELGRNEEALTSYVKALLIRPEYPEAHYQRGNALAKVGRFEDAIRSYDKAVAIKSDYAEALNNRGNALTELRHYQEAVASYDAALLVRSEYAEAINNRGTALKHLKRLDEALADYRQALAINPEFVDALYNLANTLKECKRYEEAIAAYEAGRALRPDHPDAYGLLDAVAADCDWDRAAKLARELPEQIHLGNASIAPFALLAYCDDPSLQLLCAKNYIADLIPVRPEPLWKGALHRHDRIRIAYASANFRRHPMSYLMAHLFESHDRSRFEVFGVSFGIDDGSPIRARVVRSFDRFFDVRTKADLEIASLINDLQVDILIDLQGYTQDSRPGIVAYRPAPIQVSYLGHPATLGSELINYVIADEVVLPFDQQEFVTEKIVHLPDTYYVTDSQAQISPKPLTRGEAGLPDEGFVFCCFNNNYKITSAIFDVWMRLLGKLPGSVLWLLRDNAGAEKNLRRQAAARGIDGGRLIFAERLPPEDHLARHRLADLFLDTLPYNAHTTACDALWTGLPVLTCQGRAFAGRVAASLLGAIGLPELVTHDLAEYELAALRLATDESALASVRERLLNLRSTQPLFDSSRFCRHLEQAYATMHEIWSGGGVPRSFKVASKGRDA